MDFSKLDELGKHSLALCAPGGRCLLCICRVWSKAGLYNFEHRKIKSLRFFAIVTSTGAALYVCPFLTNLWSI